MIDNKRIVAIIPARKGSKRLPKKNIIDFLGKPLIYWTINSALQSKYIDRIIVSTDSDEIINLAKEYGVEAPFLRPSILSKDSVKSEEVIMHTLDWLKENGKEIFEYFILLQPTSPFRKSFHIDESLKKIIQNKKKVDNLVSISEKIFREIKEKKIIDKEDFLPINFDNKSLKVANGAIYISRINIFKSNQSFYSSNSLIYKMDKNSSIDIDTLNDLNHAKKIHENDL